MPIHCPLAIRPVTDETFGAIDKVVMRCAYDSQNELGRLCDEKVYENDLADRLCRSELEVHTQVPVTVSHRDFVKIYRLDLVVSGVVYELKTVSALISDHDAQAIHYAVMLGTDRVKLINFRSPKVVGLLKCSPMYRANRTAFEVDTRRWLSLTRQCGELLDDLKIFLADIGTHLEARLYEEALIHLRGGEIQCVQRIPVTRSGLELGSHRFACHAPHVGFLVTSFTGDATAYEQHLYRLLRLTDLRGIQWLNLCHSKLEVVTLVNGKGMEAGE